MVVDNGGVASGLVCSLLVESAHVVQTHPTLQIDGVRIVRLQSAQLHVDVAPAIGGRVVSIVDKKSGHEFLWRNPKLRLEPLAAGAVYDPNFYGGIDELLPNDTPESVDGLDCPDHGELWTTELDWLIDGDSLRLAGDLPVCGLRYQRRMFLHPDDPCLECSYRITNLTAVSRCFLWKLHASLAVAAGDTIECPAKQGQVVDPAWSRYTSLAPFAWPTIDGEPCNVVPWPNGSVDFFYLFGLINGTIAWRRPNRGLIFRYQFDTKVFPYAWLFASYGGFDGHYTTILEPCTAMPLSLVEAASRGQCSRLEPGQSLETRVKIWAGPESLVSAASQDDDVQKASYSAADVF